MHTSKHARNEGGSPTVSWDSITIPFQSHGPKKSHINHPIGNTPYRLLPPKNPLLCGLLFAGCWLQFQSTSQKFRKRTILKVHYIAFFLWLFLSFPKKLMFSSATYNRTAQRACRLGRVLSPLGALEDHKTRLEQAS